ncbi:MAG: hypothetical protein GX312_02675 [Candidatus Phytoplasma sp.]|nr:hypothetical protein [Phytoplasma sp.]
MDQNIYEMYKFLYEYGNPIIVNEAAKYIGVHKEELRQGMLESPKVQYWIDCLHHFKDKPQVHNAADICFENAMHKLLSYGVREADDKRIHEINTFILEFLNSIVGYQNFFDSVNATILASWLACMGHTETIIIDVLRERVEFVYSFVKHKDYNIHVDPKGFPAIPKTRAMHPLVNPKLYENNIWRLPTIHDIFAYAHLPKILHDDKQIQRKIDAILEYIFDERYQRLYSGYGLMLVPPNRYYGMGWSMHLCRYFENNSMDSDGIVWQMALMSNFKKARETEWFKNNLEHLKSFKKDEVYEFPASYLMEVKNKYYVLGYHMGLGENRKKNLSKKLESTAWMLRIIHNNRC